MSAPYVFAHLNAAGAFNKLLVSVTLLLLVLFTVFCAIITMPIKLICHNYTNLLLVIKYN